MRQRPQDARPGAAGKSPPLLFSKLGLRVARNSIAAEGAELSPASPKLVRAHPLLDRASRSIVRCMQEHGRPKGNLDELARAAIKADVSELDELVRAAIEAMGLRLPIDVAIFAARPGPHPLLAACYTGAPNALRREIRDVDVSSSPPHVAFFEDANSKRVHYKFSRSLIGAV